MTKGHAVSFLGLAPLSFTALEVAKWGFPKIRGTIGDPQNKDYSILGSILGFPYFGE